MAYTLHVDVVSAEDCLHSGVAEMVFAPASCGEVGILPHHAPLLTLMRPGEVRIREVGGQELSFYVSGGILEVQPHGVIILSDTVLRSQDIDEREAQEARDAAERALRGERDPLGHAQAQALLAEAQARLRVAELHRARGLPRQTTAFG